MAQWASQSSNRFRPPSRPPFGGGAAKVWLWHFVQRLILLIPDGGFGTVANSALGMRASGGLLLLFEAPKNLATSVFVANARNYEFYLGYGLC